MPYHLQRYLLNEGKYLKINISLFSMKSYTVLLHLLNSWAIHYLIILSLIYQKLKYSVIGLEKEKGVEPKDFPTYTHEYGDGRNIPGVKLYPNEYLADFRAHFNDVWLLQRAQNYFFFKKIKLHYHMFRK